MLSKDQTPLHSQMNFVFWVLKISGMKRSIRLFVLLLLLVLMKMCCLLPLVRLQSLVASLPVFNNSHSSLVTGAERTESHLISFISLLEKLSILLSVCHRQGRWNELGKTVKLLKMGMFIYLKFIGRYILHLKEDLCSCDKSCRRHPGWE